MVKGRGCGTGKENRSQAIFRRNFHWMGAILSVEGCGVVRFPLIGRR